MLERDLNEDSGAPVPVSEDDVLRRLLSTSPRSGHPKKRPAETERLSPKSAV